MPTRFPHLDDSKFPGVNNVNPYRFRTDFDYTRWDKGTTIKLCNVNWCNDYDNVVKFDNDSVRDRYFDNIQGESVTLESAMRILPGQTIKLPVPFDELVRYNYLYVDFSTATSDTKPLNYETASHTRRFYFFVNDVRYAAPSATECIIDLDVWTTYINKMDIDYMMLERGHAPMAATDVDEYLADPISNNRYLLADDFTFGEPAITASSDFIPFGAGNKYVLFASTIAPEQLAYIGEVGTLSPTDPRYVSDSARNGYQAIVDNLSYGVGDADYSKLNLPTSPTAIGGSVASGYSVYAVSAPEVFRGGFIEAAIAKAPQFVESIAGVFVVDESMIVKGAVHNLFSKHTLTWNELAETGVTWELIAARGVTYAQLDSNANDYFGKPRGFNVYEVQPRNALMQEIKLTRDKFGYPDEYSDIAKLYTFPYAALEISDADGNVASLKVEETGNLEVHQRVSLAYPYLRFEAFFNGIGTNTKTTYTWKSLTGIAYQQDIPAGAFRDFLFGYDIPAYSIFMNGYDSYRLHNYNANNKVPEAKAALDYENGARSANTVYENALLSTDVSYANSRFNWETASEIARRNAQTGYANAKASNATGYDNTIVSAATSRDTGELSASTGYTNAVATADTGLTNANASNAVGNTNAKRSAELAQTNANASSRTALDNTNASADIAYTNAEVSAALGKANTANTNTATTENVKLAIALSSNMTSATNSNSAVVTRKRNSLNQAIQAWTAGNSRTMQDLKNDQAFVAAAGDLITSAVDAKGQVASGNPIGAISTGAHAIVNTVQSAVSAGIGNQMTEANIALSQRQVDESSRNSTEIMTENTTLATTTVNLANTAHTAQTANTVNASNANAASTYNVSVANASRTRDNSKNVADASYRTATANAGRSYGIANENADRTLSVSNANAKRSRDTTVSIAGKSRDTSIANLEDNYATAAANATRSRNTADSNAKRSYDTALANADALRDTSKATASASRDNAKEIAGYNRDQALENAQRSAAAQAGIARLSVLDRRMDKAIEIGTRSGDATPDEFRWRGLQIRVVKQNEGAIAQAGDYMLRYGYALNQMWRFSDFRLMPKFTFWKCSDLWITGSAGIIEGAQAKIKGILKKGVTVWQNPDEIGQVSIYENH